MTWRAGVDPRRSWAAANLYQGGHIVGNEERVVGWSIWGTINNSDAPRACQRASAGAGQCYRISLRARRRHRRFASPSSSESASNASKYFDWWRRWTESVLVLPSGAARAARREESVCERESSGPGHCSPNATTDKLILRSSSPATTTTTVYLRPAESATLQRHRLKRNGLLSTAAWRDCQVSAAP